MVEAIRNGAVQYVQDLKLMSRNAWLYLFGSFFIGLTFAAFQLLLNLYLRERGFGESFIGSVLSAGAIGMTLVSIPGAILLSRVRLKPILAVSTLLYMIFGGVSIFADSKAMIWMAYFVAGMMLAFYRLAAAPFYMRNSTRTERPYLFSLSFGIAVMAGVIGSFAFGKLVHLFTENGGYDAIWAHRLALMVGICFSAAALVPFALLATPNRIPDEDRLRFDMKRIRQVRGLFFRLSLPYFIVGAGAGMIIPFLNLFFRDRFGQSSDQIGFYFGLVNLTMFVGVMAGPLLVKKIGMVRTIVFTQLASIPFMLILAFSYTFPLVVAAFLIRGGLMNMGHPIGTNFAMEMVPRSYHGLVNAILSLAWTSSWMVSAQVGGIVIERLGYTVSLVVAVILYVISSGLYYALFHDAERKTSEGMMVTPDARLED